MEQDIMKFVTVRLHMIKLEVWNEILCKTDYYDEVLNAMIAYGMISYN